jgi:enamine deaminase RidA (YjgF/YER057c/UK114 family)
MSLEARLQELGIELPEPPLPAGAYLPGLVVGDLLFLSGQTPKQNGRPYPVGRVGAEVTVEEAAAGAGQAVRQALAAARATLGSLDAVRRVVRLTGYVRAAPGFDRPSAVIDGASNLLVELLGPPGMHARSSVGVAELPGGAAVEIELILAVEPGPEPRRPATGSGRTV